MNHAAAHARAIAEAFDRSFAAPARVHEEAGAPALAIRAGGAPYVVFLADVALVARMPKIVPLPGASPKLLGLAGVHGTLVSVFSLPALLGYPLPLVHAWLAISARTPSVAIAFEQLDGQIAITTRPENLVDLGALLASVSPG